MSEFKLQKPVNTFKEEMVNFYVTLQLDSLNILMQSDKLIRFYNFYGKNIRILQFTNYVRIKQSAKY